MLRGLFGTLLCNAAVCICLCGQGMTLTTNAEHTTPSQMHVILSTVAIALEYMYRVLQTALLCVIFHKNDIRNRINDACVRLTSPDPQTPRGGTLGREVYVQQMAGRRVDLNTTG